MSMFCNVKELRENRRRESEERKAAELRQVPLALRSIL